MTKQTSCIEKSRKKPLSQMKSTWRNLLLDWLPQVWQHDRIPGVGRRRTRRRPGGRGVTGNGGTFVQASRNTGWRWRLFLRNCSSTSGRLTARNRWKEKRRWQLSDNKLIAALDKKQVQKKWMRLFQENRHSRKLKLKVEPPPGSYGIGPRPLARRTLPNILWSPPPL